VADQCFGLAMVEWRLGQVAEAARWVRRAYRIQSIVNGPEHPDTLTAAEWLAEHDHGDTADSNDVHDAGA
jgi:hypothetical protein